MKNLIPHFIARHLPVGRKPERLVDTGKTIKPRNDWKRLAIEQKADIKAFCAGRCINRPCQPECPIRKHAEVKTP